MARLGKEKRELLEKVCDGSVTRGLAAAALGISPRTVNRWLKRHGMKKTTRTQRAEHKRKAKKELRALVAGMEPKEAAELAEVSVRTVYRWHEEKQTT